MAIRYNIFIQFEVIETLSSMRARTRNEITHKINSLKEDPFQKLVEVNDSQGRTYQIVYAGRYEITFWVDHFEKEVRIVKLKKR